MIATGIILLCLVNLIWDFIDYTSQVREFRQQTYERIALDVAEQFDLLGERPSGQDVREYLQSLQEREKIAFFIIKGNREPASSSLPERVSPDFQAVTDGQVRLILDHETNEPQAAYVGEKVDDHEVVIGKFVPQNYMTETIAHNRAFFWRSFFVQLAIFIAVVLFSFRELSSLVKSLQWGGGRLAMGGAGVGSGAGAARFSYSETRSIASAIRQVARRQKEDSGELENLRSQIIPSLLTELQGGEEPPYEFEAIMVRVDINDSTRVYSTPALRKIQDYWFDYFKMLSAEAAGRYGGLLHEENGDEVIFYFKAAPDFNAAACAAVACLRDIFSLADECDTQIRSEFDFRFRLKAAVDVGRLRVYKASFAPVGTSTTERRVKIEGASGDQRNPFLTTVRMLKFVDDKTVNAAVLSSRVKEASQALIGQSVLLGHRVPGIDDAESYSLIRSFSEIDQVEPELKTFFRSDRSLIVRLTAGVAFTVSDDAAESVPDRAEGDAAFDSREDTKLQALKQLGALRVVHVSRELQQTYLKLLSANLGEENENPLPARPLATLVALAPKFVKDADFLGELSQYLARAIRHADHRIQANAIEVWGELGVNLPEIRDTLATFRHNRARANALEVGLKARLDSRLLKQLAHMLNSSNPLESAAGCYATGEIIAHYRQVDPLVLGANPELNRFIEKTKSLVQNENPMIRRQAERAIAKIGAPVAAE